MIESRLLTPGITESNTLREGKKTREQICCMGVPASEGMMPVDPLRDSGKVELLAQMRMPEQDAEVSRYDECGFVSPGRNGYE